MRGEATRLLAAGQSGSLATMVADRIVDLGLVELVDLFWSPPFLSVWPAGREDGVLVVLRRAAGGWQDLDTGQQLAGDGEAADHAAAALRVAFPVGGRAES